MSDKDIDTYDEYMTDNNIVADAFFEALQDDDIRKEFAGLVNAIEKTKGSNRVLPLRLKLADFVVSCTTDYVWEKAVADVEDHEDN